MQNFVGKTKCIVGYMKVADYSSPSTSFVCCILITILLSSCYSPKRQRFPLFNLVTTSCIVTRIVPLIIDKHGGMFVKNLYPI